MPARCLSQADVDDVLPEPGGFRVLLRVPGGITADILRMPSAKDVVEHRRSFARILDLPYSDCEPGAGQHALPEALPGDGGLRRRGAHHPPSSSDQGRPRRVGSRFPGGSRGKFLDGGEWPERPSLCFLVHWSLRRADLCDPKLCPDSPDDGRRCDHCPLDRLDAASHSESGALLQRALHLEEALEADLTITLDEIAADEFWAVRVIREERNKWDRELQGKNAG